MLSSAVSSMMAGSQLLVSIMLSTHNRTASFINNDAGINTNLHYLSYSSSYNNTVADASPPSPFNKDVAFPHDIYSLVLWALAWAILHNLVARFILTPLSFYVIPQPQIVLESVDALFLDKYKDAAKKADKDRLKFQTAAWRAILYSISTVLGLYICSQESWVFQPKQYFEGYPHKTTFWLKLYYNIGFGNYAYQLVNIFFERRQSDFVQMVTHHVATVIVMLLSYVLGFTRAGVMVLLLHDCSDPIMEIAKSFVYAGKQMLADVFFGIFAITFLVTRDYLFPVFIVIPLMRYSKYEDGVQMPRGYGHYFYPIAGCLYILQVLNVFWGYLIMKMVAKVLASGEAPKGDIRDEE